MKTVAEGYGVKRTVDALIDAGQSPPPLVANENGPARIAGRKMRLVEPAAAIEINHQILDVAPRIGFRSVKLLMPDNRRHHVFSPAAAKIGITVTPPPEFRALSHGQPNRRPTGRSPAEHDQALAGFVVRAIKRRIGRRQLAAQFPDAQIRLAVVVVSPDGILLAPVTKSGLDYRRNMLRRNEMTRPDDRAQKLPPTPLELPTAARQIPFRRQRMGFGVAGAEQDDGSPASNARRQSQSQQNREPTSSPPAKPAGDNSTVHSGFVSIDVRALRRPPTGPNWTCLRWSYNCSLRRAGSSERRLLPPIPDRRPTRRCRGRNE